MAKRRNRSSAANIPAETLERARQQAAGKLDPVPETDREIADTTPEPVIPARATPPTASPTTSAAATAARVRAERKAERETAAIAAGTRQMTASSRRRVVSTASGQGTARRERNVQLTTGMIEELLAHPTKTVSEAELHAQYGYVLRDLRNMGVLAAALFATLIVLALFFVR